MDLARELGCLLCGDGMKQTFKSSVDVARFKCVNEAGDDLIFQCDTVRGDIRVLAYFVPENLEKMLLAFDKPHVMGVICETRLLVQVREMIAFGCPLDQMRATLQAALALVDDAMKP